MRNLLSYRKNNIYSQNGEDGVIAEIFRRLDRKTGWFCEFGAWDGKYGSNCYALLKRGWRGVMIEGDPLRFKALGKTVLNYPELLYIKNAYVRHEGNEDTLDQLLSATPIPSYFELLSIDIDGFDYHIWQSLKNYHPICVVIEIDSSTPPGEEYIYNGSGRLTSFSAMLKLGEDKGYSLICHTGNLIFIANKYVDQLGLDPEQINSPESLFIYDWVKPSRFSTLARKLRHLTWQRVLCKIENTLRKKSS